MGYTSAQAKEFINIVAPVIRNLAIERGYKCCSTIIAQAIIEGACGTSSLAKKYNNHFGMKCGSSWKGKSVNLSTKEEYTAGTLTSIKANFRAYDSLEDGMAGYFDFINTSRYRNLKDAKNYTEYATLLKQDGYATSSTYVNTLCNTVKKYDLDKYDNFDNVAPVSSELSDLIAKPTIKKGARGENAELLQKNLNQFGYKLICDGVVGKITESSLKDWQQNNGLSADGIYGNKSYLKMKKLLLGE